MSHVDSDDTDPFEEIEDLEDNSSTPTPTATEASNRNSSKFQETDAEDWSEGVDAKDDDLFDAPASDADGGGGSVQVQGSAYVKSKIQELTTVQEQAESTKDNPNILIALGSVLDALRKQIESAYDHAKIDEQDHATLLERLHSVREIISSK
jgi:hypothetical protein